MRNAAFHSLRGALLACLLAADARAQDPPAFAANAATIRVDVAVTRNRRPLAGLRQQDFVLRDNGQPRPILSFWREELPLDIVLVYNTPVIWMDPRSTAEQSRRLQNGAAHALKPMRPGDRVAFVAYGSVAVQVALPFTADRPAIAAAIMHAGKPYTLHPGGIWSEPLAIEYGVRLLEEVSRQDSEARTQRRRLIILITGGGTAGGSAYADEPIIRRLWQRDIALSTFDTMRPPGDISFPSKMGRRMEPDNPGFRRSNPVHIAQATGGDGFLYLTPDNPPDLLTPLRLRYTVWFDQPEGLPPGQEHPISVDLSEEARRRFPDAIVQAREGYVTR